MKQILEELQMTRRDPLEFRWRGRDYRGLQNMERWFYRGKWWLTANLQGEIRNYYRVSCQPLGASRAQDKQVGFYSMGYRKAPHSAPTGDRGERVFEIFYSVTQSRWMLSRVVD